MSRPRLASFIRVAALVMMGLALAASATAPKVHDIDKKLRLRASFDQTWTALIEVFADRSWAIATLEKDSGIITTDWMGLDEDSPFADCGSAGIASVMRREIRFNVFVRDAEVDTHVTVNATFREERRFDNKDWFVDCTSTGRVESLIHGMLADAIASHRPLRRPEPAPAPPPPAVPAAAPAPADGTEGGACYGNQTCNAGLTCDGFLGRCVAAPSPEP
jgi:hypothetical protein